MRNILSIIFFLVFITNLSLAQTAYDINTAKAMASSEGKLIIMDFTASWCGPCKTMETELWHNSEFLQTSDKFILLKVDIDYNKSLANRYGVKSIPRVIVMTVNEDRIVDKSGYRNAKPYLDIFSSFPTNYTDLNTKLFALKNDNKNYDKLFAVGIEFQKLSESASNLKTTKLLIKQSNRYLKKAIKETGSDLLEKKALISLALNYAYSEKFKKAKKKLQKIKVDNDSHELQELKQLALDFCNKSEKE